MQNPDDLTRCYFCGDKFLLTPGTAPGNEDWAEEVGEFWSTRLQTSVIAHPDCLPKGITATLLDEDDEWKLA